jgi:hypothetical protein
VTPGPILFTPTLHNLSLCSEHRFLPGLSLDEHSRFEESSDRNPNLEDSTKAATIVIGLLYPPATGSLTIENARSVTGINASR